MHHFGFATSDLDSTIKKFGMLAFQVKGGQIFDEKLKVKIQFMTSPDSLVLIELISPLSDEHESPVHSILKSSAGFYHIAFLLQAGELKPIHLRAISACLPAKAFEGAHVQFFTDKDQGLVELIYETEDCGCLI